MTEQPGDQRARDRFSRDWAVNLAVVANAGSGKTTAISERLAAMALSPEGESALRAMAVVTYTKKAAAQISQRARAVLLRRMAGAAGNGTDPLARLDRAFFGTIHSFCLLLARRHGSTLGIHLNPTLIEPSDEGAWDAFLEQDPMVFSSLSPGQIDSFLRHTPLDQIFNLARELNHEDARHLIGRRIASRPPSLSPEALERVMGATSPRKGATSEALLRNQETAREWARRFNEGMGGLPIPKPEGKAAGIHELYRHLFAPLKAWLAEAGGVLAAELSLRYRQWRLDHGIQSYADQIETALAVVEDPEMLERIRAEGWRVILDEAQDTDPQQFSVLVEITRPPGAKLGTWPDLGGTPPKPGHFCMVGDAQQGIYRARADIGNFQRHVAAFEAGKGGEALKFDVTFRVPHRVVGLLNDTMPAAFGPGREHNLGLAHSEGAPEPLYQVRYEPLVPGPANPRGAAWLFPVAPAEILGTRKVADRRLAEEARSLAVRLVSSGAAAFGARTLGEICILAPRNAWLAIVRDEFGKAGVKTALQMRRNRTGDNPVYAWLAGILAVVCDPENIFEWSGVLREVFAVSDPLIAAAMRSRGGFSWENPENYPGPLGSALEVLGPFIARADAEGDTLERFSTELSERCGLAEKARLVDPEGALEDELERLLARAAELGRTGAGPRAWLSDLLGSLDTLRAAGSPAADAVNLITSHSAKGLEWPVVIPVGLWREIKNQEPSGLRIVAGHDGAPHLVLDNDAISAETQISRERERLRELVRLLYVTLTRAKSVLVIPWPDSGDFERNSFGALWGLEQETLDLKPDSVAVPECIAVPRAGKGPLEAPSAGQEEDDRVPPRAPALDFPARILPHELAAAPDLARAATLEAALDVPLPAKADAADPLDYGLWWHETLEFLPWSGLQTEIDAHGAAAVAKAGLQGFGERAGEEWNRLLVSEPYRQIKDARWSRLSELGIFAPLGTQGWIDGVIDLVLHDPESGDLWIVDWKTNRQLHAESESQTLSRLALGYKKQLTAYGSCISIFFPGTSVKMWVYSTPLGAWSAVEA